MIHFKIDTIPPKSTHQSGMRIMKRKNGTQFVGKFANSKSKKAQTSMTEMFEPYKPSEPLQGPLKLSVLWSYPYRKAEPKKNRLTPMMCDTKPDCDNLSKMVQDILGKLDFYIDDGQIAHLEFKKTWSNAPGITITITTIKE